MLNYDHDGQMFLHCKHCLSNFLGSDLHEQHTPQQAMNYEASSYPYTYSDGTTARILVLWCKDCHRRVWDSRHLSPLPTTN